MLKNPPRLQYKGLTVILSNPSRFDKQVLLSGTGGHYFTQDCLGVQMNKFQCDLRVKEDTSPLLPNTKCILALGEPALKRLYPDAPELNAQRGSPFYYNGIPVIASYLPQDCVDLVDHEGRLNPHLVEDIHGQDVYGSDDAKTSTLDEKKHLGKTSRRNWAFWLKKDVEKAILTTQGEYVLHKNNFNYIIYPDSDTVISLLSNIKNQTLYFDMETDADLNITVFAFSFGSPDVYVVPVITHDYNRAYHNLPRVFQSLAIGIYNNCCVAHNGSGFDFFVLAHKYKIPIGPRVYDTMLSHNRIFPEVEKSLGHSLSLPWLYLPYHKDEANFCYGSASQAEQLWRYCGKDVSSLILLKEAQDKYAKSHIGIRDSIDSVNSYIKPYLTCTMQGIKYDEEARAKLVEGNDRKCEQLLRIAEWFIGKDTVKKIRRKTSKSGFLNSNSQCVAYFHDLLGYDVMGRSKKTKRPSLGKKYMYKLRMKYNNPVIDLCLAYRKLIKESGSLGFTPWKVTEV